MGFIQDFKEFAIKGNAIELAVGVIIGAAFGKVVNSVVTDLFNPVLGYLIGGVNFTDLKFVIQDAVAADAAAGVAEVPEVAVRYGAFIDTCVQFAIVAFSVFVAIRVFTKLTKMGGVLPGKKPA